MELSIDVSMRDLRNHTKQVIERVEGGTTMYLTKNGARIATITPVHPATWADHVDDLLQGDAYDSGLSDVLAEDEARSADFDDDHLGSAR